MLTINAEFRKNKKTAGARLLRKQKKCPAIIYNHLFKKENFIISLNYNEIQHPKIIIHLYKNNIIKLDFHKKNEFIVKIQEVQYHPFKPKMIHIDFLTFSSEKI